MSLPELSVQLSSGCPSQRDAMDYANSGVPYPLAQGFYRVVLVGDTALNHANGGSSELAIYLWTPTGLSVTEFIRTASASGVSERSFQYVHMPQAGEVLVFARVGTTCGSASLSGVVAFERVRSY